MDCWSNEQIIKKNGLTWTFFFEAEFPFVVEVLTIFPAAEGYFDVDLLEDDLPKSVVNDVVEVANEKGIPPLPPIVIM